MNNLCKTCKHWDVSDEHEMGHSLGLGKCKAVPMFWNSTEWDTDGQRRVLEEEYKNTKAFCQDASDCLAYLLTMPDFGCVQHEVAA